MGVSTDSSGSGETGYTILKGFATGPRMPASASVGAPTWGGSSEGNRWWMWWRLPFLRGKEAVHWWVEQAAAAFRCCSRKHRAGEVIPFALYLATAAVILRAPCAHGATDSAAGGGQAAMETAAVVSAACAKDWQRASGC